MTRKMKAILVLFFAAEIVNSAKVGVLKGRIADLETQRDIYASRAQNWLDRAVEDEEVIDSLQIRLDETADRKIELTEAGTFFCTAYCTEQYEHICGEGHGITASGQPIQAGVTVAADTSILGEDVPRIHPALLRTHNHRQQHPAPDRAPISQRDWDAAEQEEPALSMRMELSDLPPKYRAQAEAQIAARCRAKAPTLEAVAAAAKKTGREFDSRGEYDYYMGMILPKVQRGEIVKVESHRRFTMLPEKEYGNVKLPAMHYTPDFVLTYADGTVEVVEVKSKFTRRQQRDYIHRRRIFIDLVAEPRGWRFVEHITPDTAAEIKAWKKCAQQTERKG